MKTQRYQSFRVLQKVGLFRVGSLQMTRFNPDSVECRTYLSISKLLVPYINLTNCHLQMNSRTFCGSVCRVVDWTYTKQNPKRHKLCHIIFRSWSYTTFQLYKCLSVVNCNLVNNFTCLSTSELLTSYMWFEQPEPRQFETCNRTTDAMNSYCKSLTQVSLNHSSSFYNAVAL